MDKENRNFIIILVIATVISTGVIAQNVRTVINPESTKIKIDVEKVKRQIDQAGLKPREAMHWKEL